jgi:hypothetical protein
MLSIRLLGAVSSSNSSINTGRSSQEASDGLAGCAVVAFVSNPTTTPREDKKPNANSFIKLTSATNVSVDSNPGVFPDPERPSLFVKLKNF